MQAPEGVTILYTLDGSEPTAENGTLYEGPIAIDKVAVLRARGFADGLKASEITTETYLLNTYHSLPVICLTVDPVDLWDPSTGIYADGIDIDAVYGTLPSNQLKRPPFDEATYWIVKDNTSLREKAGNFEMYTAEGEQLLNQGVAVQLHGQFSLDLAQKSFRITARPNTVPKRWPIRSLRTAPLPSTKRCCCATAETTARTRASSIPCNRKSWTGRIPNHPYGLHAGHRVPQRRILGPL